MEYLTLPRGGGGGEGGEGDNTPTVSYANKVCAAGFGMVFQILFPLIRYHFWSCDPWLGFL